MSPYIIAPADVPRWWVGVNLTGEVNIVAFTDVVQLEGISDSDGNPGPIYYSAQNNKINYNQDGKWLALGRRKNNLGNFNSDLPHISHLAWLCPPGSR